MTFPNAAKGIKKIFSAEILYLIASIAAGIMIILSAVYTGANEAKNQTAADVSGIMVLVVALATGVLLVIGMIFMIIGTIQAASDEPAFKGIIFLTILNLVVAIIAACFSGNSFLSNLANGVNNVVSFICSILVILGVANLGRQINSLELVARCGKLLWYIIIIGFLSIFARFFAIFMGNIIARSFAITLVVISIFLSIVQYILYLSMLARAKKELAQN